MNKLTLVLLLVALGASVALARTAPQVRRPFKFAPGQTYVYEYRGRQWNGLVNLADQYAGLNLDCDVILQAQQNGQEVLMKLDDIKVEQLHTQTLPSTNEVRSLNAGEEKSVRQEAMFREELAKPLRFVYTEGKVLRFIAQADDQEWSINIKKSILSLFQLDLAPTRIIKSAGKIVRSQYEQQSTEQAIRSAEELPLVYPIYEEHFGGICETQYEIDSVDNTEERQQQQEPGMLVSNLDELQDVLNVTKTVNYKNCLTDPSVSYDRHSFHAKSQTAKGKLFATGATEQQLDQSVFNTQFHELPEELKEKYSNSYNAKSYGNDVASNSLPVERYSYTKYNMTTLRLQNPAISERQLVIEGVFSESKIRYQTDGDELISDTQQSLKLVTVTPTGLVGRVLPAELAQKLLNLQVREPSVPYETIQCELNAQKLKFYQAVWKFVQAKQQIMQTTNTMQQQQQQHQSLYSHQTVLPFALSASWYPLVATQTTEQSLLESLNPEQLAQSYENLLESLADDVLAEDVVDSKRSGEKVIRMINLIAFMPKYKLVQLHADIIEHIKQAKQEQLKQVRASGKPEQTIELIDNTEVAKWKIVRKLFLDTLPLAGSKQAVEMIEQLVEQQLVKPYEAKELCEAVPANIHYPDTEIIDAFVRLSQLPQVRKQRATFASCSIATGKLIASAWAKSKDASFRPTTYEPMDKMPSHLRSQEDLVRQVVAEADPRRQLPLDWNQPENGQLYKRLVMDEQDLIGYIKLYKQMLAKATSFNEKVVYIETLAHMKVPHVLPILEPYVTGRLSLAQCLGQQPLDIAQEQAKLANSNRKDWASQQAVGAEECNYLRTIAIYSLAHVIRSSPGQVQAMLLPVFDNTYEPYQLRIAAFTSMMLKPVEEHVLERIASQMWREPSKEVASFVVGTIDTFAKFMSPQLDQFKWAALKASESMPKQYLDTWKFSSIAGGSHFNHKKQEGAAWLAEIVKSNVSSIPRGGYLHYGRFHGPAGSKYDNTVELGFTAKGIESLLKQYIAYNNEQQQGSNEIEEFNVVASILENLYSAKDDLVKFYREARDELKSQLNGQQEWISERLSKVEGQGKDAQEWEKEASIFIKRQQPIEGVNSQLGKQERKLAQLFDSETVTGPSSRRDKRSVTIQARQSEDDDEEPKLTLFTKFFEQTSYHALDKRALVHLMEKADDYIKMVAQKVTAGGNLHYVKLMMKQNNWHMIPSQLGLPIVVTERIPIVMSLKIDASANGQLTSSRLSQQIRQQQQQQPTLAGQNIVPNTIGHNFVANDALNLTAIVHPKIMMSKVNFMFAVEQAQSEAYGVQVEKSHQISLPMEVSVAYSAQKQLASLAIQPKCSQRVTWAKEVAKTFIAPVSLTVAQADNWLGREHMVRYVSPAETSTDKFARHERSSKQDLVGLGLAELVSKNKESRREAIELLENPFKFQKHFVPRNMEVEFQLDGVTDDDEIVRLMTKPELASHTLAQWTSTEDVDQPDQHTKSGPLSGLLHVVEAIRNRPTKYLEYYTTIKSANGESQPPVYRFDFVLKNKHSATLNKVDQIMLAKQQMQASMMGRRTGFEGQQTLAGLTRADIQAIQREIEENKKIQMQQQLPIALEVY